MLTEEWHALAREAGLASEHIAIGVTALGRANHAENAYYGQAFFALSIGFERSAKIARVVEYALRSAGVFPSEDLRRHGHKLRDLLNLTDEIAERLGLTGNGRLPQSKIHTGIISTLSDFADNITRYYNLDFLTGAPRSGEDAIAAWYRWVTLPVLSRHYEERHKRKHDREARAIDHQIGGSSLVLFHSETGVPLQTPYDVALHGAAVAFSKQFERMYVLQIAKFIGAVLSELGDRGQRAGLEDIPYLSEFYGIYNNEDQYFRSRKTWSIYR